MWTTILQRTDLKHRFVVIEWMSKYHSRKHIAADPERVRKRLQFLLQNHPEFMQMDKNEELKLSKQCTYCKKSYLSSLKHFCVFCCIREQG